ncbi:hypothetical protein ACHAXS_012170 [Conticribra weissflogii]
MSSHTDENTPDEDDYDLQDEDLDAFLLLLESRLRADFTSPDLSRTISSQGTGVGAAASALPSGNPSSPSKFLRLIGKVFHRAAKPIKLRALLSVLGLEPDRFIEKNGSSLQVNSYGYSGMRNNEPLDLEQKKTDSIVWEFLSKAEHDDEQWVRLVAGILRGMMFCSVNEIDHLPNSTAPDLSTTLTATCRGKAAQKQLRKITEEILQGVQKSSVEASKKLEMVKTKMQKKSGEVGDESENRLRSLLIKKDACPTFVPFYYSLLSSKTTQSIIPEITDNSHFSPNMNVDIFKIDAEVEEKRAEEEAKEMQLQTKSSAALNADESLNGQSARVAPGGRGNGRAPSDAIMAGRMRGRFANLSGRGARGGSTDTAASLLRPSRPGTIGRGGRPSGVVGRAGMAGRALDGRGGRVGMLGRIGGSTAGGRGGVVNRLDNAGRLGGGRSSAIAATRAPLQRRVPGSTRAMLNASGRGSVVTGGESSKMKVIDVAEVEGLNRAQKEREKMEQQSSVEARKAERKRKLLEQAAKSGLKSNRDKRINVAPTDTNEDQRSQNVKNYQDNGNESQPHADDPFPLPDGLFDVNMPVGLESYNAGHGNGKSSEKMTPGHQNHHDQQHEQQHGWESLLEKSNKLSDQDRQNIHQFFENRTIANPIPSADPNGNSVWKVKLNEEKTVDPQTNEVVKETLYLELDYQTFGYKKTRKIKRK